MTGGLSAKQPALLLQPRHDVTVTHADSFEGNIQSFQPQLQTKIAHDRTDHTTEVDFATPAIPGNQIENLVTVNNVAKVIDHDQSIAITIKGDPQVSFGGKLLLHKPLRRGGTTMIIDVQPDR